jgi:hypothetical protein
MAGVSDLLDALHAAQDQLEAVFKRLVELVHATAEAPRMPNYERAEDQLRVALRAAAGAEKALRRRLQLARERAHRRS